MTPRLSGHFPLFGLAFFVLRYRLGSGFYDSGTSREKKSAQIFSLETTWNLPLSLELRSLKKITTAQGGFDGTIHHGFKKTDKNKGNFS